MPEILYEINQKVFQTEKYFNYKLFALGCKYGQGAALVHCFFNNRDNFNLDEDIKYLNGLWNEPS